MCEFSEFEQLVQDSIPDDFLTQLIYHSESVEKEKLKPIG